MADQIGLGYLNFENLDLFRISTRQPRLSESDGGQVFEFGIYGFRIKLLPMQSFLGQKFLWWRHV
jgi:hypothetical protein